MNVFLGTFDGVLAVMSERLGVDRVIAERGRLRNARLQSELLARGVVWDEPANRSELDALLGELGAVSLCVVAGFSHILRQPFIDRCRDVVNFHPGIIQQCRGPQPVAAAILRGHTHFGVTAHRIDSEAIDAGPVLAQRSCAIDYARSYGRNYDRIKRLMVAVAEELLPRYQAAPWPAGEPWIAAAEAYYPRADSEQIISLAKAPDLLSWSQS